MENVKMTKVKALEFVLASYGEVLPAEVKEKLESMSASIAKKNSSERKPSSKQIENQGYAKIVLEYLATVEKASITEMLKVVPQFEELTNQKLSAVVRGLKEEGKVTRFEEKRKAYFALPTEEEVIEVELEEVGEVE